MYGGRRLRNFVNSTGKFNPTVVKTLKSVLCSSRDGVPLKIKKENLATIQFINTDRLSLVSTPVKSRWTIPFKRVEFSYLECSTDFITEGIFKKNHTAKTGLQKKHFYQGLGTFRGKSYRENSFLDIFGNVPLHLKSI